MEVTDLAAVVQSSAMSPNPRGASERDWEPTGDRLGHSPNSPEQGALQRALGIAYAPERAPGTSFGRIKELEDVRWEEMMLLRERPTYAWAGT